MLSNLKAIVTATSTLLELQLKLRDLSELSPGPSYPSFAIVFVDKINEGGAAED